MEKIKSNEPKKYIHKVVNNVAANSRNGKMEKVKKMMKTNLCWALSIQFDSMVYDV